MPVHTIDYSVTVDSDSKDISELTYSDSFRVPISKLSFQTDTASMEWLGKEATASLTNEADVRQIFSGYVNDVNFTRFPDIYDVSCGNILTRARNHWIITNALDEYWTRSNISASDLVKDLLAEAGITDYSGEDLPFTFGTKHDVEFNLLSVMDAIDQINNILATTIYMDGSTVKWGQIFPVPDGSASLTLDEFISISKTTETRNLRNKVVVFGNGGIYAEASAVSPYLPTDFYQTAIVSSQLIDTQDMADQSAAYNLELYNKLGEELKVEVEGVPGLKVMDTVKVVHSPMSIDENWFVYSINHTYGETFTTRATLRK